MPTSVRCTPASDDNSIWQDDQRRRFELVFRRPAARAATVDGMSSHMQTRRRRRVSALVLAAAAVGLVVVEPFPKGKVLLSLAATHGVDTGDIPAVALLLVAVGLAI
jgi:hypothetical protein